MALGRSSTPKATSSNANACTGRRSGFGRSATASVIAAASSQATANNTSRQIMPTNTNAGGVSAMSGVASASHAERRAAVSASRPKPAQ